MSDAVGSPEIAAMVEIEKRFETLAPEAQARVLRWVADRFGVALGSRSRAAGRSAGAGTADDGELPEFETLAELMSAASAANEPDRALVGAYWFQFVKGEAEVDAQRVNTELKHLGHRIGNITGAFGSLMERRPQYIIQTKKSGTTRQARKKYKVTISGKAAVETMLRTAEPTA